MFYGATSLDVINVAVGLDLILIGQFPKIRDSKIMKTTPFPPETLQTLIFTIFESPQEVLWPLKLEKLKKEKNSREKLQKMVSFFLIMFSIPKLIAHKKAIASIYVSQQTFNTFEKRPFKTNQT